MEQMPTHIAFEWIWEGIFVSIARFTYPIVFLAVAISGIVLGALLLLRLIGKIIKLYRRIKKSTSQGTKWN